MKFSDMIFVRLFILTSLILCIVGEDRYLVCKSVTTIFDENQPTSNSSRCSCNEPGRPGKRGAKGFPGVPGPIGPPGVVNYSKVDVSLRSELQQIKHQLNCFDGVVVGSVCYRLVYRVGVRVSLDEAKRLCVFHGGELPEIPTEETYTSVINYIKRSWSVDLEERSLTYVHVFLASKYRNGQVLLRNGEGSYIRWYPGFPTSTSGHDQMFLRAPINPSNPVKHVGMFNYLLSHMAIPLCQFVNE